MRRIIRLSYWLAFWPLVSFGQDDASIYSRIINGGIYHDEIVSNRQPLESIYRDSLYLSVKDSTSNLTWYLAQAIRWSKQGYLDRADIYWEAIKKTYIHTLPDSLTTLVWLENASHEIRKNNLDKADSIYQNIQLVL